MNFINKVIISILPLVLNFYTHFYCPIYRYCSRPCQNSFEGGNETLEPSNHEVLKRLNHPD
jgi:hypothetical protein